MELINSFSKQRGRVIDFKDILYGYWRMDPVYGVDLILDLLLVYRKYRGHKMTVQVRRHAYVQQMFAGKNFCILLRKHFYYKINYLFLISIKKYSIIFGVTDTISYIVINFS